MRNPEDRAPGEPPWLFRSTGLLLLVGLSVLGLFGAPEIALLCATLALVALASRGWNRLSLERVRVEVRLPQRRAFRGDTICLEASAANRKLLPLPWLEVWIRVAHGLEPQLRSETPVRPPPGAWTCLGSSLWPYARARWREPLTCVRRGVFAVSGPWVRGGDPFGLWERCRAPGVGSPPLEVVVYPRVVSLPRLALPLSRMLLDRSTARSSVVDLTRTRSLRAYVPGDPPRLVHWPATAHTGTLQVRVPEPITRQRVTFVVDAGSFESAPFLRRAALFETALAAIASMAVYLHRQGVPAGLVLLSDPPAVVPAASGETALAALLETLARAQQRPPRDWGAAVRGASTRTGALLLAGAPGAGLERTLVRLAEGGNQPGVLVVGDGPRPTGVAGDRLLRVHDEEGLAAALAGA